MSPICLTPPAARRSNGSATGAHRQYKRLSNKQKGFLRKLIHVLTDVIHEEDLHETDDAWLEGRGSRVQPPYEDVEEQKTPSDMEDQAAQKRLQEMLSDFEPKNAIYLKKSRTRFSEKHSPLVHHVKGLLHTLGGGGQTVDILEKMDERLYEVGNSFFLEPYVQRAQDLCLYDGCAKALNALSEVALEMINAFEELGIFNTGFFDTLRVLHELSESAASILSAEYGLEELDREMTTTYCVIDKYLDSIFEPLVTNLEKYIRELTGIAEKEIPTIRQSQEFISQRYLNLTTIATFLSNVTATTLQITADGPVSTLTVTTNSLWSISLVFSSASAVYSLLVMTWRQSSIRGPDLTLPTLARVWLQNAPIFALIVALVTFSIGLCLLAFLVADQQGKIISATVPTSLTGLHALAILALSARYILERSKAKRTRSTEEQRNKRPRQTRESQFMMVAVRLNNKTASARDNLKHDDIESGSAKIEGLITARTSIVPLESQNNSAESPVQCMGDTENSSSIMSVRPGDLIQFSPGCRMLAVASSSVVLIYAVESSFSVLQKIVVPDAGPVRQILWDRNEYHPDHVAEQGRLVVRSSAGVYMYIVELQSGKRRQYRFCRLTGFNCSVSPIRWTDEKEVGLGCLSCLLNSSFKVFERPPFARYNYNWKDKSSHGEEQTCPDINCKELCSWDLSKVPNIGTVLDAALFGKDELVCLSRPRTGGTKVLVFDRASMSIRRKYSVSGAHTCMSVYHTSRSIYLYGDGVTDIIDHPRGFVDSAHEVLWPINPEIEVTTLGRFGNDEDLHSFIIKGEICIFHEYSGTGSTTTCITPLHRFTTPFSEASVENTLNFAYGHCSISRPYLFAFAGDDGSVKIWSIFSNTNLRNCKRARLFEVHDKRHGRLFDPEISVGRYTILPPHDVSESRHSGDERAEADSEY